MGILLVGEGAGGVVKVGKGVAVGEGSGEGVGVGVGVEVGISGASGFGSFKKGTNVTLPKLKLSSKS